MLLLQLCYVWNAYLYNLQATPQLQKFLYIIDKSAWIIEAWNIQLRVDFVDTTEDCVRVFRLSFISLKYLKRL